MGTENDRNERARACTDSAETIAQLEEDPVIGLSEEPEALIASRIETVQSLCQRILDGEVDKAPVERHEVKCPKCGVAMKKQSMPGNYCDSCGGKPAYRCPNHDCD